MRMFLDANVFLHAIGQAGELREACGRILRRIADGSLKATTNTEVVQEVLHVLIRRGHRDDALAQARNITLLFPDMIPIEREDVLATCGLLGRHPALSVRDALHTASALRAGLDQVISVDSDFDQIREVRRVDPRSL
jgi:predicted nucleic acid-binding protein